VRLASAVLSALILSACASPTSWTKPGASDAQAAADQTECRKRFTSASYDDFIGKFITAHTRLDRERYALCLRAKGYTEGPSAVNANDNEQR